MMRLGSKLMQDIANMALLAAYSFYMIIIV